MDLRHCHRHRHLLPRHRHHHCRRRHGTTTNPSLSSWPAAQICVKLNLKTAMAQKTSAIDSGMMSLIFNSTMTAERESLSSREATGETRHAMARRSKQKNTRVLSQNLSEHSLRPSGSATHVSRVCARCAVYDHCVLYGFTAALRYTCFRVVVL